MGRSRALTDAQVAEALTSWRLRSSIPTLRKKAAQFGVSESALRRAIGRALGKPWALNEKTRRYLRELRA